MNMDAAMSRREALGRLSLGSLLAFGLWPGALRADNKTGGQDFTFVVINDTHCMSPECLVYLAGAVRAMKDRQPALCLHAGDVTEKGEGRYMAGGRDALAGLGVPVYTVPGNHDYLSQTDRKAYEEAFPNRINYWFAYNGWQFVGLDTTEGQHSKDTRIAPATFAWLDENLRRLDPRQPTVIFTHFPLGTGVSMRPLNAEELLARFGDFNLQAVYCGHYHGFTEHLFHQVPVTTNRCCALKRENHDGTKQKGFFVCTAAGGKIQRQFVEYKPKAA
jgi:hypothetical protein